MKWNGLPSLPQQIKQFIPMNSWSGEKQSWMNEWGGLNCWLLWVMGASAPLPRANSITSIPLIPFHAPCSSICLIEREDQPALNERVELIYWSMKEEWRREKNCELGKQHITHNHEIKEILEFLYGVGSSLSFLLSIHSAQIKR